MLSKLFSIFTHSIFDRYVYLSNDIFEFLIYHHLGDLLARHDDLGLSYHGYDALGRNLQAWQKHFQSLRYYMTMTSVGVLS